MVRPKNRSSTAVCRLVRPRWDCCRERFQKQTGHKCKLPITENSSESLKFWISVVRRTYAGWVVGTVVVSSDKTFNFVPGGIVEEDIVKVRDQVSFSRDIGLKQSKYSALKRWLACD